MFINTFFVSSVDVDVLNKEEVEKGYVILFFNFRLKANQALYKM